MKKVLVILFLVPFISKGQVSKRLKPVSGTWMNVRYYEYLTNEKDTIDWTHAIPRILYIGKDYTCIFENHFEHKYSAGRPIKISLKAGGVLSYKSNYVFDIVAQNDSNFTLKFKDGREEYFKKISNSFSCTSCGIQLFLDEMFWQQKAKWKMIRYGSKQNDTLQVIIKYGRIYSASDNKLITEYEFTDDYRVMVKNEKCFGLVFFDNINNLAANTTAYLIKKAGNAVCLFREGHNEILFTPLE